MRPSMPSPVGHALAGVAVALVGERNRNLQRPLQFLTQPATLLCIALATLPDADLLVRGFHRTVTHSLGATALVTIVAIVVTAWVTRSGRGSLVAGRGSLVVGRGASEVGRRMVWVVILMCAAAHGSHLLTDWLGADYSTPSGIQLLWPFSDRYFRSGWDIFPQIERRRIFSAASIAINVKALTYEVLIMGTIVIALWFWRARSRSGAPVGTADLSNERQA
jgi:membrane-bound metal-dependent hydrolase YbcI (DUF457 family)